MDDTLSDGARLLAELDRSEFERARAKITTAPVTLTDHDFVVLTNYAGEAEARRAWEARRVAQLAIVRQHQAAPLETKTAEAPTAGDLAWTAHVKSHGHRPVAWPDFGAAVNQIFECLKTHKHKHTLVESQTKGRFETLEARVSAVELANTDLAARVTALEDKRGAAR